MKSTWTAIYENNKITIENTWFNGERLYVNDVLQDDATNIFSAVLTGHLINAKGEKESIKANLGGFLGIDCKLFVNDKLVAVTKEK